MPLDACYSLDQTLRLLSIPSPTGYPRQVCGALVETLEGLGFSPRQLRKGGVVCPLGGEGRPLALAAHVDTLGLMVRAVKPDGRLAFTCLGGPSLQAVETENVTVITRGGQRYTGVVELRNASKHVNRELDNEKRDDTTLEILLDEEVSSREDVERLGIAVGDIVCLDPRARVTGKRLHPQPLSGRQAQRRHAADAGQGRGGRYRPAFAQGHAVFLRL